MLTTVIAYLPKATKALVAFVGGVSAAYAGSVDGGVSADEWVIVVASGIAAGVAVWLAPNKSDG